MMDISFIRMYKMLPKIVKVCRHVLSESYVIALNLKHPIYTRQTLSLPGSNVAVGGSLMES
jgi:hypothetical protein